MAKSKGWSFGILPILFSVFLIFGAGLTILASMNRTDFFSRGSSTNLSGAHYNLNIIGVPKNKTADITTGNRIFVPLAGTCKISLTQGSFSVIDGNCTDGSSTFQLPSPDPTNSGTTTYSVYVRALGKPGGTSSMKGCAVDPSDGNTYCSASVVSVRNTGKSSFTNVSKQLLYIYADLNLDGTPERYPLFDSALQDYFWQYDNNGLKLLQMRFYPSGTSVQ